MKRQQGPLKLLVIFLSLKFLTCLKPAEEVSTILHSKLAKYNKNLRPNYGEELVTIAISAEIFRVLDISDKNMEFTVSMEFKQTWNDTRLSFEVGDGTVKEIGVGAEFAKNFWVPDTFFANEKLSSIPKHLKDTKMFLTIQSSGAISLSRRLVVTASCEMDLRKFPLDSQVCSLEIQSSGHSVQDMQHSWLAGNDSVRMLSPDMPNNPFTVGGIMLRKGNTELMSGIYKTLVVDIKMKRRLGHFVKTFYIPVGVSVIISWLSFLIPPHHATARVVIGLGMLCIVVMLEMNAAGMTSSVAYVTAGDMFGGGCCLLIIMSLVVSILAICAGGGQQKSKKLTDKEGILKRVLRCLKERWIDLLSFIFFPVLLAVFTIKYWQRFDIQYVFERL